MRGAKTSSILPAGRRRMTTRGPDAAAERATQIVGTIGFAPPSESAKRAISGVGRRKRPSKFGFPRFAVLRLSKVFQQFLVLLGISLAFFQKTGVFCWANVDVFGHFASPTKTLGLVYEGRC